MDATRQSPGRTNLRLDAVGGGARQSRGYRDDFGLLCTLFSEYRTGKPIFNFLGEANMSIFNSPHKVKRLVLAGAVTATTIAGTLYGAGIKTEREVTQVRIGYGPMYIVVYLT